MFYEMSTGVVIWDEEKQHMFDHPGLLKQLAQGGDYLIGEEKKLTPEPPSYDVLTHVSGSLCLLELGLEAVHEFDEIHPEDNHARMPDYVQFMDPVTSKGASHMMLDEMQNTSVVWDDELLHGLGCQDALVQVETQFDKCLNVDNNAAVDLGTRDSLTHSNDMDTVDNLFTDMPLEVRWDEEMQYDIDMHESLLQQLALSVDDEKTKHTVELHASIVLTRADNFPLLKQCMGAPDQVCDSFPGKVLVWDEQLFHQLDSHDGLPQQLALGGECWDGEKMICIPLSPGNKWSCSFSDVESVKLHMTAQIDKVEAILTEVSHVEHELGTIGCQVLGCRFRKSVLDIRQETIAACKMLPQMPFQGRTNQLLAQSYQIFSPREYRQQLELCMMPERQSDPACQMVLAATKWWQEHFSPWKSNLDQHHSEKRLHLNIHVFGLRDGVQQHFRIAKRLLSVDSGMHVSAQVCMSELVIDSYLMKAYIPVSQWDPGISEYVTRRPFLARILLRDLKPYELYTNEHMNLSALYKSVNEENYPSSFSPCRLPLEDIPPREYDCFNPRECTQLEIYMITLIQWDPGLVEWYKSNYLCTDDTRLVESGIDSILFTPSAMLNDSLFFYMKYCLPLLSQRYISSWCISYALQGYACHAVAWGQATFCGGGNVTPTNSKVSKALADMWATYPWDPGERQDVVYKL